MDDSEQISLFEMIMPIFKFTKKIRLIEMFGGIGAQAAALERLNADFEHYRLIEFDKFPVASYNAIHGTDFEPKDITKTHAEDLGIVERDKYQYLATYSFPCQDLSLAGKGRGMKKGSGTRSGLLWEVERILNECGDNLPDVLVMENVPQVISDKNMKDMQDWVAFLERKGYQSYHQLLNAKDYGVPQSRLRCFMISIKGDYLYYFPKKIKLEKRLRDLLEDEVDEKYFLSEAMLNTVKARLPSGDHHITTGINIFNHDEADVSATLTCKEGQRSCSTFIAVKTNTKKGYEEAEIGDSVNLERPTSQTRRGRVGKGVAQTILCSGNQGVVVEKHQNIAIAGQFQPKDRDYNKKGEKREEVFELREDDLANAILTNNNKNCVLISICTGFNPYYKTEIGIRKLTPRECWRLMGFTDADFDRASKVNSNAQLYKQAGNSIVVDVLMAIFKQML